MEKRGKKTAKDLILNEAEKQFSERGYFKVTAKEISEAAGVNTAAVNYYFGGKDGLYLEVLKNAHQKMVSEQTLDDILAQKGPAKEKLRTFFEVMVGEKDLSRKRAVRLFLLEMSTPSSLIEKHMGLSALPKLQKLSVVIAEITGFTQGSVKLRYATGFVLLQSIGLLIFPEFFKAMLFGEHFAQNPQKEEVLLSDYLTEYAYGGLEALKRKYP